MFGNRPVIFSINEIQRNYPNEWVAILVSEIDDDGFALNGLVLVHDSDEKFVWSAVQLGEDEEPVYVFHTGTSQIAPAAA